MRAAPTPPARATSIGAQPTRVRGATPADLDAGARSGGRLARPVRPVGAAAAVLGPAAGPAPSGHDPGPPPVHAIGAVRGPAPSSPGPRSPSCAPPSPSWSPSRRAPWRSRIRPDPRAPRWPTCWPTPRGWARPAEVLRRTGAAPHLLQRRVRTAGRPPGAAVRACPSDVPERGRAGAAGHARGGPRGGCVAGPRPGRAPGRPGRGGGRAARPTLVSPATLAGPPPWRSRVSTGCCPASGGSSPCDWGLGFEVRDAKRPTGPVPATARAPSGTSARPAGSCGSTPWPGWPCGADRPRVRALGGARRWPALPTPSLAEASRPRRPRGRPRRHRAPLPDTIPACRSQMPAAAADGGGGAGGGPPRCHGDVEAYVEPAGDRSAPGAAPGGP